jgi:hypothetical protein
MTSTITTASAWTTAETTTARPSHGAPVGNGVCKALWLTFLDVRPPPQ